MDSYQTMDPDMLNAFGAGFILTTFLVSLVLYLFIGFCFMKIANRTGTDNGWWAFIPILNILLILDLAQKPRIWALILLGMFIPFLNILVALVIFGGYIYLMMEVAENVGKPKFWGIIAVLVAPVGLGYMAFAD